MVCESEKEVRERMLGEGIGGWQRELWDDQLFQERLNFIYSDSKYVYICQAMRVDFEVGKEGSCG